MQPISFTSRPRLHPAAAPDYAVCFGGTELAIIAVVATVASVATGVMSSIQQGNAAKQQAAYQQQAAQIQQQAALIEAQAARENAAAQANQAAFQAQVALNNKTVAERNAQLARISRDQALMEGVQAEQNNIRKTRQLIGALRANTAASGLDVDSGSAADLVEASERLGNLGNANIRDTAARKAMGYSIAEANYMQEAGNLQLASELYSDQGASVLRAGEYAVVTAGLKGDSARIMGDAARARGDAAATSAMYSAIGTGLSGATRLAGMGYNWAENGSPFRGSNLWG